MKLWTQTFTPSFARPDGFYGQLLDQIPTPDSFTRDRALDSIYIFGPNQRGGDHIHTKRQEVFVGLGPLELLIEDQKTHVVTKHPLHSSAPHELTSFHIPTGLPHAVQNIGDYPGILIELASHPTNDQEKIPHQIIDPHQ